MIRKHLILVGMTLIISGCIGSTPKETPDVKPDTDTSQPSERCLVTNPTDIFMTIAGIPGSSNNARSLESKFVVTAPTPGYLFRMKLREIKKGTPKQIILDLEVARPSGIVPQVITKTKVDTRISGSMMPEGSSVQVYCGGKLFFKVDKLTGR